MKIHELLNENELLDEGGELPPLRRKISKKGWRKEEGGAHEKWFPPAGTTLPDNKPFISIPRGKDCNPHTLRKIKQETGLLQYRLQNPTFSDTVWNTIPDSNDINPNNATTNNIGIMNTERIPD